VGNSWSWNFDSLGRTRARSDPDAGNWSYQYDDAGRLTQQTDGKLQVTTFSYDSLVGRPTGKASPLGTTTMTYGEAHAGFFNLGRITTVTSPGTTLELDYDQLGRTVKTTRTIGSVNYVFQKSYDPSGSMVSISYPDTDQVGPLAYDQAGRLRVLPGILTDVQYDAAGRPTQRTNANGTETTYGYSASRGFLESLYTAGPSVVQNLTYTLDPAGLVTQVTSPVTNEGWSYQYDDLYRLTQSTSLSTPGNTQGWTYDEIGRITFNSRVGAYTYPGVGQPRPHAPATVNGASYTYDPNGNLASGGGRTPTWDAENRIAQIGVTQFSYDAFGERIKKTASGLTSTYPLGDDYEITKGVVTKYISIDGLGVVAKRVGAMPAPATFWLHSDRQGSIQAITDAAGAIVQRRTYRPYGDKIADATAHVESRGWIDQRQDETGITYLHARYYDPQLGTFLSPDPIGPAGGLNSYGYGVGNPANFADPTGLDPIPGFCYPQPCGGGSPNGGGKGPGGFNGGGWSGDLGKIFKDVWNFFFGGGGTGSTVYGGAPPPSGEGVNPPPWVSTGPMGPPSNIPGAIAGPIVPPTGGGTVPPPAGEDGGCRQRCGGGTTGSTDPLAVAADVAAGFGDTITFGATGYVRQWMGTDSFVNRGSTAYSTGEWAGFAHSFALGGAGGVRMAGTRVAGLTEFSHWIPSRYLRDTGSRFLRITFGRSILNGNYVTPMRHYLHDPFRYPSGWRSFGPRFSPWLQQLDRTPWALRGAAGGGAWGGFGMWMNDE